MALSATAQTGDVPVTTLIEGNGVDMSPTLHIQSDLAGAYQNSKTVQSVIQSIGDWVLNTAYSSRSTRKALVDFRDPVPNSGPNGGAPAAPFAYQQVQARFISKCSEYGNSMFTLAGGMTTNCPLVVRFDYGGSTYRIQMNRLIIQRQITWTLPVQGQIPPLNATSGGSSRARYRRTGSGRTSLNWCGSSPARGRRPKRTEATSTCPLSTT